MKVLIVDHHPLIREALANLLAKHCGQVEVRQAGSVQGALAELEACPDTTLVLLDLILPDAVGTSALEQVRQAQPHVPVVVLSAMDDPATVLAALNSGAMGFIPKRSPSAVLMSALRLVLAGEIYIPAEVLRAETSPRTVLEASSAPAPQPAGDDCLTPRQMEVLALLAQGKPNKVISRELGLASGTVRTHISAIFRALGVSNRTQAVFVVNRRSLPVRAEQQ